MADPLATAIKRLSPAAQKALRQSQRSSLTPAQAQLRPYVQAEEKKQRKKWSWLKPLEFVFDLLQRGQYTTANMVQSLIDKGDFGDTTKAAWEGITGKRKGTYKTTFFGGQDVGGPQTRGLYKAVTGKETPEALTKSLIKLPLGLGDISWADIIGFAGDVLLDPTTWMTFGGTRGAKFAADQFAEQVLKQRIGTIAPDLAKVAQKGFDAQKVVTLMAKNGDEAMKYMSQFIKKKDIARVFDKTLKKAYKEGLRLGPEEMQQRLLSVATEARDRAALEGSERLAVAAPQKFARGRGLDELMGVYGKTLAGEAPAVKGMGRGVAKEQATMKGLMDAVTQYEGFAKTVPRAGERAWTPFGAELFKGHRQPNVVSRTWDTLKEGLAKTKPGEMFEDAWWSVMNKGPVGALRKIFGFRNPYQKLLRAKEMRLRPQFRVEAEGQLLKLRELFEGVDDKLKNATRDIMAQAEKKEIDALMYMTEAMFDRPNAALAAWGLDKDQAQGVNKLVKGLKEYTDELFRVEQEYVKKGLLPEFGGRATYLPDHIQTADPILRRRSTALGPSAPGFTQQKTYTFMETSQQEIEKIRWLFGLDEESARILVKDKNWSTHSMDLQEMMMHRGIGHAQAVTNAKMVEQFREFGIPMGRQLIDDISKEGIERNQELMAGLMRAGGNLEELGLKPVQSPLMEGLYFDKDVAEIIDRVTTLSSSDEGMGKITKAFRWFSSHWRSIATLSPGFHLRNAQSNMFTLWMKNGPAALDVNSHLEAFVGTLYALGNKTTLKQSGIPESTINSILNRRVGGKTIRELAEHSRNTGLITRTTMAFDNPALVKEFTQGKNLLQKASPVRASRELGSVVESTPKFQSVLTDLKRMLKEGDEVSDDMIDWTVQESKKWFFDYDDLTDAERNVWKNVFPFYTWLRKNVALQLYTLGHYKHMMSIVPKAIRAAGDESISPEELDDYIREEAFVPTEREGEKVRGFRLDLPFKDINLIPLSFEVNDDGIPIPHFEGMGLWKDIMGAAHPLIKTVAEVGKNPRDIFRERDLGATAIAPRALRYLAVKPEVLQFLDGVARRVGAEDGLGIEKDSKGRMMIDSNLQRILENNFILLQRIAQLEESGETFLFPKLDEWLNETTGYSSGTTDMDKMFRSLSFLFGIKPREVDLDQTNYWRFREMLKEAETQRAKDRRREPSYQTRSMAYQRQQAMRMRRLGYK